MDVDDIEGAVGTEGDVGGERAELSFYGPGARFYAGGEGQRGRLPGGAGVGAPFEQGREAGTIDAVGDDQVVALLGMAGERGGVVGREHADRVDQHAGADLHVVVVAGHQQEP